MHILLKKFGTVLVSRPAGKEAFLSLQPTLNEIKNGEKIEIDFDGVAVLTPSWADEFITPLLGRAKGPVELTHTGNPSVKATLETLDKATKAQRE